MKLVRTEAGGSCWIIGFALFVLVGCDPVSSTPKVVWRCKTPEERERAATFVIECAFAANPMSDEEGEDLVEQCQETAEELLCTRTLVKMSGGVEVP